MKAKLLFLVALTIVGCTSRTTSNETTVNDTIATAANEQVIEVANSDPKTIGDIPLPEGFERVAIEDTTSFAYFLRNLPLKPLGTPVYNYRGDETWISQGGYAYAVIDGFGPGNEDLQQCADAIIRLRAEWLWRNKRYDEIAFHFTNGDLCEYKRFAEGESFTIKNNKIVWYKDSKKHDRDYSYEYFLAYLNWVFMYAGTMSLEKELSPVDIHDIKIGDVFIEGGSPGHAVIIVDVADDVKKHPSEKCFLVAESYMPAQDIHILKNPNVGCENVSPWYMTIDIFRNGNEYDFGTYAFNVNDIRGY